MSLEDETLADSLTITKHQEAPKDQKDAGHPVPPAWWRAAHEKRLGLESEPREHNWMTLESTAMFHILIKNQWCKRATRVSSETVSFCRG